MQRSALCWTKQRLCVQPTTATSLAPSPRCLRGGETPAALVFSEPSVGGSDFNKVFHSTRLPSRFSFFQPHRCENELAVSLGRAQQSSEAGSQARLLHRPDGGGKSDRTRHPSKATVMLLETRPFLSNTSSHPGNDGIRAGGITIAAVSLSHINGGCNAAALTVQLDACQVMEWGGRCSIQSVGFHRAPSKCRDSRLSVPLFIVLVYIPLKQRAIRI